jgi:hypothetical protein
MTVAVAMTMMTMVKVMMIVMMGLRHLNSAALPHVHDLPRAVP